jgi:succinoglycan biosynthesis transport protein ExoP
VDLVAYLAVLRRRWLAIFLCLIAGAAGGFDVGHSGTKVYSATAQCLVNIPAARSPQDQVAFQQLSAGLVSTYAKLVSSRSLAQRVASDVNVPLASVRNSLSAEAQIGTFLINVSAESATPTEARTLANAAAGALSDTVGTLENGVSDKVTVQVVDLAVAPTSPLRPRPTLDLVLGLVLGLLGGFLVAGIFEALDRTVKTTAQADALIEAPLLGVVPKRRGPDLVLGVDADGPEGEPYRSLRTNVRFLDPDRPLRSILVTSPIPGEGKTATAANLAVALALSGERVVVLDADLRRARLARVFGVESSAGLTSLVLGTATLDDVVQEWGRNLQIVASGPLPPNPSEILGSQLVNGVLAQLAGLADVVIIDAPPVLPVADAVALGAQVDGVIMVLRHGVTPRVAAAEARRRLESVGARCVGYVLNGVPTSAASPYYADYDYDRGNRALRKETFAPPKPNDDAAVPETKESRSKLSVLRRS